MSGITRRGFVKQSTVLGLGLSAGLSSEAFAANDKINVACIGVRGRGNSVMHSFAAEPDCDITHICDVREPVRRQRGSEMKQKTGRMPKLVNDYRTPMQAMEFVVRCSKLLSIIDLLPFSRYVRG